MTCTGTLHYRIIFKEPCWGGPVDRPPMELLCAVGDPRVAPTLVFLYVAGQCLRDPRRLCG